MTETLGLLVCGDDWPDQVVVIVAETPSRYRVRARGRELRLPLRNNGIRIISRPGTWLVPKHTIQLITVVSCG